MADWSDPRVPAAEVCVLRYVLEGWAAKRPDAVYARFEDGGEWSYGELLARTRNLAAALQAAGVRQGSHVVVWLPNGPENLLCFCALGYIGAVYVPINTAYRGQLLAHVIGNAGAALIVAHGDLLPRLAEVPLASLRQALVVGPPAPAIAGLQQRALADCLAKAGEPLPPERPIRPWDTQSIVYTSGTTGPSKGVLSSYLHAWGSMNRDAWYCVKDGDRFLITMPFFHIGGCFIAYSMLCRGGSIAMTDGFRTDRFWRTVRESGSSIVFLLGVMGSFLLKAPPDPADREHPLKTVFIVPFTADSPAFGRRFGVEVYTIYNMTEIATPLISGANPVVAGLCGRPRAGFELRLVDENDLEVAPGQVGELIIRPDAPWALNHGYNGAAEATARAWRNGWFHTGDAMRRDVEGNYHFVDRTKDAIRRRGENISSFEVEAVLNEHPDVQECAAIPVPSQHGEDEVMAVLAAKPGRIIDPRQLIEFLRPRMAHFMVPRYVRILPELPKTPTTKIQKAELRKAGVTADTWDREAAGIVLRAERLRQG
ncbi:MAG: ATP-dependent acyl-CoA ligase [Alphaproteobacteria bacterium]|nr:ATP-dependent acyl-CoA ligase [Alphaproteobacteria bacterium]